MARQQAVFPQINFVNGLVTEATALTFPENACTEAWNCVFDRTGRVSRRPGLDVEDNFQTLSLQTVSPSDVYSEHLWEIVGTQDSLPILVLQRGSFLYFFLTPDNLQYSSAGYFQTIDLTEYVPTGSAADPSIYKCSYAEGRGNLLVVNRACDSLYLQYDESTNTVTANRFNILFRDVRGVSDGLALTERPTASVAGIRVSNPNHYYNILNQGWHLSDALAQWDTARSDLPSNADVPSYYRASETDVFNPEKVNNTFSSVANTPAAKGHFILDAGSPSRTDALVAEGFSGATVSETTTVRMNLSSNTTISGGTVTRPNAMFDLSLNQNNSTSTILANNAYLGKTFSATAAIKRITLVSSTQGYGGSINIQVYGKTGSAPANSTDGTLLATIQFTEPSGGSGGPGRSMNTSTFATPTELNHIWIRNVSGGNRNIAELYVFTGTPEYNRPQFTAFFAGRAFYAGLANEGNMNSIYFSQIIERDEQYGLCYQKNDPTDENFFDLLPDDGGVITIPDIGLIRGLIPYQNSLIIIASNGVWTISGSSRGPFKADDYEVRKISDISTLSTNSIVSRRGIPIWWAEEGIYTVNYDPNYDSFQVENISQERIFSFIKNIPLENRSYVRGVYDYNNDIIFWLYREEPFVTPSDRHTYNRILCMDGLSGAYYPWSFREEGLFRIKGFILARTPEGGSPPTVKYIVENPTDNTTTFAEIKDVDNWVDWSVQGDNLDYLSYFLTGYKVRGETMKEGNITYFMPFIEEQEDTSLFVQSIFDYYTLPSSGKWSSKQQCYREGPFNQSVRYRRLKVRGTGKALQLLFTSESGKPFSIIGWSTLETVASDV